MFDCNDDNTCITLNKLYQQNNSNKKATSRAADIIFITDPICSHCWAIEPAWRKLNLKYDIKTRYIHGGLLPGWNGFEDTGNSITKPTDVIPHWQYIAEQYQQPIDASMWLNDPISNSYILCKAAIAMRLVLPQHEANFVRYLREQIFIYAKNMAKEQELAEAAQRFGFDEKLFYEVINSNQVQQIFIDEQNEMAGLEARGFPTLLFTRGFMVHVYGSQQFEALENALLQSSIQPPREKKLSDTQKLQSHSGWTITEACQALDKSEEECRQLLLQNGYKKMNIANGEFWSIS